MRSRRQERLRDALFLLVGVGMTSVALIAYGLGFLNTFERQSVDARFSIRGRQAAPKDVVVVGVDDRTFSDFPDQQWPYPRSWHAKAIEHIAKGDPRAIALDIQFSEFSQDPNEDNALYSAIADRPAHGKVVLATTEVDETGANGVGKQPAALAVGDLDGDGVPDVVTADAGSNDLSFLIGYRQGTFFNDQPAVRVGPAPRAVVVGNLDGKRYADLAVANSGSDDVSILLGRGPDDGNYVTYRKAPRVRVGKDPVALALRDLNGDGRPDLVVANRGSDDLSILLGNGDGTFTAERPVRTGASPGSIAVGDLDGDGKPDLAVAEPAANDVSILLGNGRGGFTSRGPVRTGVQPSSIAVGDLDHDGKPDLAVADSGSNEVSILLGRGDGTFSSTPAIPAGAKPSAVAIANLDGDGKLDLAVADSGANHALVLTGDGTGRFRRKAEVPVATDPRALAVADLNGDGRPDLVVANRGADSVSTPLGHGDARFSARPAPNLIFGPAYLLSMGARAGNSNFKPDTGGIFRKLPYGIDGIEHFALVTAEVASGHRIRRAELGGKQAWIDFAGPAGTITEVPYSRVCDCAPAGQKPPPQIPSSFFRGKTVVIGATATSLQDIHATSTAAAMSGPEIQADAIETALENFPLKSTPSWMNVLLIVALGLAIPLIGIRVSPVIAMSVAVLFAGLFSVATQLAFDHGRIVSFVYPLTALALSSVGALVNHYVVAAFERERVRDVFSRFVPETVVDQVLAQAGGDLRLGGKAQTSTVMFSDLRGFTSSAEHMPPEAVIDVLNHYLGEMSDAILAHGGTLMSYIGDGIYAVFGAPIEQADHADRALAAAREMLEVRLPRFNGWMKGAGLGDGYRMGIGLNTGSVMSGNVGHERRLEYTAVGDTVNTASRIEGMTKGTPYMLFVAESTFSRLTSPTDELVYVDEVEIRGRQQRLKLWGWEPAPEPTSQASAEVPVRASGPVEGDAPVDAPARVEPA